VTRRIRTYADVGDAGGGDIVAQVTAQSERLQRRLGTIAHVIAIASGKGGVGKSFITANLAAALVQRGQRVGVVDADLNGPTAALMLGAVRAPLVVADDGVHPAATAAGCTLMSMDLLLASADAPVRWREPAEAGFVWQSTLETGALREFIADTAWGELDYLLVDLPPGTDRIARLLALVPRPAALLLITTPSAAATGVVARSVTHARDAGLNDIALISNMDGHVCAACGTATPLFGENAGTALAERMGVPLWAAVPFDPFVGADTDRGRPVVLSAPHAPAALAIAAAADALERHTRALPTQPVGEAAR
jgi:ATP-binding protein involved in chromosome partitioning